MRLLTKFIIRPFCDRNGYFRVVISAMRASIQVEASPRVCWADFPSLSMGAPIWTWMTPGRLMKLRRGQYSPALCATGTIG